MLSQLMTSDVTNTGLYVGQNLPDIINVQINGYVTY